MLVVGALVRLAGGLPQLDVAVNQHCTCTEIDVNEERQIPYTQLKAINVPHSESSSSPSDKMSVDWFISCEVPFTGP